MRELRTKRLVLREMPANLIADCLHDPEHALLSLGLRPAAQWPTADTRDILSILAQMVDPTTSNTGFNKFWLIARQNDKIVIGDAGFKGNPSPHGEVEVGYGIVPDEWQKGYGFEAVQALANWAVEHDEVRIVRAECHKDNSGSIRILMKCGFTLRTEADGMLFWDKQRTDIGGNINQG